MTIRSGVGAEVAPAAGQIRRAGNISPPTILMATAVVIAIKAKRIDLIHRTLMPCVRARSSLMLMVNKDLQNKVQPKAVMAAHPAIRAISHLVVAKISPNKMVSGLIWSIGFLESTTNPKASPP